MGEEWEIVVECAQARMARVIIRGSYTRGRGDAHHIMSAVKYDGIGHDSRQNHLYCCGQGPRMQ